MRHLKWLLCLLVFCLLVAPGFPLSPSSSRDDAQALEIQARDRVERETQGLPKEPARDRISGTELISPSPFAQSEDPCWVWAQVLSFPYLTVPLSVPKTAFELPPLRLQKRTENCDLSTLAEKPIFARLDLIISDSHLSSEDVFGRRITKSLNGDLRQYVYDGEDRILTLDPNSQVLEGITHGPGIDEPIVVQEFTPGQGPTQTLGYATDWLGSVTQTFDWNSGDAVSSLVYDSFGRRISVSGSPSENSYTGREWDEETGAYYYRSRYYDPAIGRFTQGDPIAYYGQMYAYAANNPVILTDSFGLWPAEAHRAISYAEAISEGLPSHEALWIAKASYDIDFSIEALPVGPPHFRDYLSPTRDQLLYALERLDAAIAYGRRAKCESSWKARVQYRRMALQELGYALHAVQDKVAHVLPSGEPMSPPEHVYFNIITGNRYPDSPADRPSDIREVKRRTRLYIRAFMEATR